MRSHHFAVVVLSTVALSPNPMWAQGARAPSLASVEGKADIILAVAAAGTNVRTPVLSMHAPLTSGAGAGASTYDATPNHAEGAGAGSTQQALTTIDFVLRPSPQAADTFEKLARDRAVVEASVTAGKPSDGGYTLQMHHCAVHYQPAARNGGAPETSTVRFACASMNRTS